MRWDKEVRALVGPDTDYDYTWWRYALDPAGRYLWVLAPRGRCRDEERGVVMRIPLTGDSTAPLQISVPYRRGRERWDLEAISCDEQGRVWVCQVNRRDMWTPKRPRVRHRLLVFEVDGRFLGTRRRFTNSHEVIGDFAVTPRGTLFLEAVDPFEYGNVTYLSCLDKSGKVRWSTRGVFAGYPTLWVVGEKAYVSRNSQVEYVSADIPPQWERGNWPTGAFVGLGPGGNQVREDVGSITYVSPVGGMLDRIPVPPEAMREGHELGWERYVFLSREGAVFALAPWDSKAFRVWRLDRRGAPTSAPASSCG